MSRTWRIVSIVGGIVVIAIVGFVLRTLNAAGSFEDVKVVAVGTCKTLGDMPGSEDLQFDRQSKTLFVSSRDYHWRTGTTGRQDGLYAMSPDHPELGLHKLAGAPADFHPHGLSLYRAPDGVLTLMVVNHPSDSKPATVEIFEVASGTAGPVLNHVGSVKGDLLLRPNDVVAVGKDRFYATNDHGSTSSLGMTLENYLVLPRASVVYYDGSAFRTVAEDLRFANGINVSPDLSLVYVSETTGGTVKTYARDIIGGELTLKNEFELARGLDNIDVDDSGNLWIASHPQLLKLVARRDDPNVLSPSQVSKVTVAAGIPASATTVYANLGEQVSGSSVGAVLGGHLYIGTIFGPGILDCALAK